MGALDELPVDPIGVLRRRRSAKWRTYPPDVLPLPVAETDYPLAPAVQDVLREAVDRSDTGYAMAAPPRMAAVVAGLPPDSRWRVGHWGVLASVAALTDEGPWLDRLLLTLDRRRAQLGALLGDRLPAVRWVRPEATYLAWLDCTALGEGDGPRELFLDRGRVGLQPGLRFGRQGSGFVRLNLATGAEVLDEAVARMAAAVGS